MTRLEQQSREYAAGALAALDLCNCALQTQLVARSLQPVLQGVWMCLDDLSSPLNDDDMAILLGAIAACVLRSMEGRLHKPGASAAIEPENRRNTNGVGEHC